MNDLDSRVRDLVGGFTDAPPRPRPWADVRRRAEQPSVRRERPRGRFTIAVAIAAVAVTVFVVVLSIGDDDHRSITPITAVPEPTAPSPTNTVTTPAPDKAPSVTAQPGAIATNLSVPPTTPTSVLAPPITPGDPVIDGQLSAINSAALAAQRSVDSLRATVTLTSSTTQADGTITAETAETNTVTFMSDGRLWSTGDRHLWTSYDPTTGVQQSAVREPDGSTTYRKVTNVPDPMLGDNVFGHSPIQVALASGPDNNTTIRDTEQAGRAAWEVTTQLGQDPAAPDGTNVTVIDKQTGLITASRQTVVKDGITTRHDSEFTALEIGVDLPIDYPGVLGPNATVTDGGYGRVTAGPLSLTDAAASFGSAIYAPANLSPDATIWYGTGTGPGYILAGVQITIPDGMARRTINIQKFIVTDATKLQPSTSVIVDGLACYNTEGAICGGESPGLPALTSGSLAGETYAISSDPSIQLAVGPINVNIWGFDHDDSLALANSLVGYPPPPNS